jgi:hypothetical protein
MAPESRTPEPPQLVGCAAAQESLRYAGVEAIRGTTTHWAHTTTLQQRQHGSAG